MYFALSRPRAAYSFDNAPDDPPIHWPSAVVGLVLATLVVVGVSWFASLRRPEVRPPVVATAPSEATTPAVVPTPIPQPALPVELPPRIERVKVANTRGLGVNLRAKAGEKSPRIKTLPEGTLLELVGADESVGGTVWRNVRDPSGTTGWVSAAFLSPS